MRKYLALSLSLMLLSIQSFAFAHVFNVRAAPYNAVGDGVHDDFAAIQAAINDAIKAGPGAEVLLPPGTYFLDSGRTIVIDHANGMTIHGTAKTKVISGGVNDFFAINNSSNITFGMMTMDSQPLRSTQGVVNSVAGDGKSINITLDKDFQPLDAPMFAKTSPSSPIDCFFWTDPRSLCFDRTIGVSAIGFTHLTGRQWTIALNGAATDNVIGKKFAVLNEGGGWPLSVNDNTGPINITDVDYYGGGGSGACVGMNRNNGPIRITGFVDGPPPGSGRMLASAGVFTAQGNRGAITIDHCDISCTKDDALDTGTDLAHILAHPAANAIVVENSENYQPGDQVQIWDWTPQMQHVRDSATITAAAKDAQGNWKLSLNHPVRIIKTGAGPGDTNWSAQENDGIDRCIDLNDAGKVTISHCRIQDSGRDFVMKSPHSVIKDNVFYQTPWCIFAAAETFWHGGPAPEDLTIINNTFNDIDICPIEVEVRYSNAKGSCRGITITGNKFINCGAHEPYADGVYGPMIDVRGAGIRLRSTVDATIARNLFDSNWGVPIIVQDSSHVSIADNKFVNSHHHTWNDWKNYGVDMGADIFIDNSSHVALRGNTTSLEGPYLTHYAETTGDSRAIIGLSTGISPTK